MTSSTKPEVHKAASSEEDRTTAEVRTHENLAKFSHVVFEMSEQTDRHTHRVSEVTKID